ncbi:Uncharacterised protein [Mycobacteroides abscessus subsp. abscessus]|nr:Uncharacterised protein [Mycobacteroides abscessus subsp. abscessus]
MGVGLQGRDKSIGAQGDSAQTHPCPAAVLAHPLPDEPSTTDFQDRGRGEQKNRLCDEHLVSLVAGARQGVYTDSRICSYRAKESRRWRGHRCTHQFSAAVLDGEPHERRHELDLRRDRSGLTFSPVSGRKPVRRAAP